MTSSSRNRTWRHVLRYSSTTPSRATVRKYYQQYRLERGIPLRCDNLSCFFYTNELSWNQQPLPLILDHVNGVSRDHSPQNLRFLCPNCDSQLPTRGGGNKGRVKQSTGGYAIKSKDGRLHHTLPAEPGEYCVSGESVDFGVPGKGSRGEGGA